VKSSLSYAPQRKKTTVALKIQIDHI